MRLLAVFCLLIPVAAISQEWGLAAGVSQTSAKSRVPDATTTHRLSFRGGLTSSFFFLNDEIKIRTGLLYTQRRFEIREDQSSYTYDWHYLDIPVLTQVKYNEMIAFFGGVNIEVNISSDTIPSLDGGGARSLSSVFQVGVNFLFDNMYGFDAYYEQGFDNIDDNVAQPSAFGIDLLYYFL